MMMVVMIMIMMMMMMMIIIIIMGIIPNILHGSLELLNLRPALYIYIYILYICNYREQ